MIVFDLACFNDHCFEGWFNSAEDYAVQNEAGMVRCPICDAAQVVRRPSAAKVHLARAQPPTSLARTGAADAPTQAPAQQSAAVLPSMPPEVVQLLRAMVANSENVGAAFPEEARKMHYKEVEPRNIRGQATREEAAALQEEGIDCLQLPAHLTGELN